MMSAPGILVEASEGNLNRWDQIDWVEHVRRGERFSALLRDSKNDQNKHLIGVFNL